MARVLGLTGGIGSGKSTVGRRLAELGADLVDADALAHASTQPGGSAMAAIRQQFGEAFLTPEGALDRTRMRQQVFKHPESRQMLEGIIHPLVGQAVEQAVLASDAPCVVLDIPLLVESLRWRAQLDQVLVVDCRTSTQVQRVRDRNGWDIATIEAILRNQCPREQRLSAADFVIFNDDIDLAALHGEVDQLACQFGL